MKLKTYLSRNRQTQEAFARALTRAATEAQQIRIIRQSDVSRWVTGRAKPSDENAALITQVTGGAVGPRDLK